MQVTMPKRALQEALGLVSQAIGPSPYSILDRNVYLAVDGEGTTRLTGYNDLVGITTHLYGVEVEQAGHTVVDVGRLRRYLGDFTNSEQVILQVDPENGGLTMTGIYDRHLVVQLVVAKDPDDYPIPFPPREGTELFFDAPALREGLRRTMFAASRDSNREFLKGVSFTITAGGEITLTAADGLRLAQAQLPSLPGIPEASFTMPLGLAARVLRLCGWHTAGEPIRMLLDAGGNITATFQRPEPTPPVELQGLILWDNIEESINEMLNSINPTTVMQIPAGRLLYLLDSAGVMMDRNGVGAQLELSPPDEERNYSFLRVWSEAGHGRFSSTPLTQISGSPCRFSIPNYLLTEPSRVLPRETLLEVRVDLEKSLIVLDPPGVPYIAVSLINKPDTEPPPPLEEDMTPPEADLDRDWSELTDEEIRLAAQDWADSDDL